MEWYLIVVLTCISLMTSDVEHLFMYTLAMCTSSFNKISLQMLHFFLCLFSEVGCLHFVALWEFFICSGCKSLIRCMILKDFSPIICVVFSFSWWVQILCSFNLSVKRWNVKTVLKILTCFTFYLMCHFQNKTIFSFKNWNESLVFLVHF